MKLQSTSSPSSPPSPPSSLIVKHTVLFIAVLCTLFGYTQGGLVWDDHLLLSEGLWQNSSLSDIWFQSVQGGDIAGQYYRPIPMTLLSLFSSVLVLHCISLLLHLGSTWLLGQWLKSEYDNTLVVCGMLLFAIHPLQTEVLGWVSCLPDILAVHFGLWSVVLAVQNRHAVLISVALLCGLLSKEIAMLPLLAYGCSTVWKGSVSQKKMNVQPWIWSSGVVLVGVFTLRVYLHIETVLPSDFSTIPHTTWMTIGLGWFGWVWPFPHYPVRDVWALPMWQAVVGWVLCVLMLWKSDKRMGWFIVMGAVTLSLPPVWVGYFAAERYLYMATVGFVWLMCGVLSNFDVWKRFPHRILSLVWILGMMGVHWTRAPIWNTDAELFNHATTVLPDSGYAWHLHGMQAAQKGSFEEATTAFTKAAQQEHSHHQSREFAIRSALEAGLNSEAFELAESGPKDGLTRGYLEVWLQAAESVGHSNRAQELRLLLEQ